MDTWYDYDKQAWVVGGRYVRCGHPKDQHCGCYGREHAGEPVARAAREVPPRAGELQRWVIYREGRPVATMVMRPVMDNNRLSPTFGQQIATAWKTEALP